MAGYTRQSVADIINGSDITAPPINAEFNQIQSAFNGTTGHSHDGSTGNAPKIDLTTSVSGYLPAVHGGIGGKNNLAATTNPTTGDDAGDGYAPGSLWENTTTGRVFICVGNTANAAVWRELVTVITDNKIEPIDHDQIDLGTPTVRFQDLYLSGGISASGNVAIGGTLNITGATSLSSLTASGTTTLNGDTDIGNANTDTVTITAKIDSDLIPTGVRDLGSSTDQWTDLFIDGTATIDTLTVDENASVAGNLAVTGTSALTGNTTVTGTLGVTGDTTVANLSASGTTTITSVDLNSGAIDSTTIGSATPAAGTFTTLSANTSLTATTADIDGGTLDGVTIGGSTAASATVTDLTATGTSTLSTVDINAGAIDGTTIGSTTPSTGAFTTLSTSGQATLATVNIDGGTIDGTAIGGSATSSGAFTTVSASGGFTGDLTGDVTGNLTGNVTGNVTGNITGNVTGNVTASSGTSTFNNVTINGSLDMDANTTATITNLSTPVNNGDAASKLYVDTAINDLIGGAPATLDTLNEIAASLNDDANLYGTLTASIATKLPLAGGTMSGAIAMGTNKITGVGDPTAAQDASTKNYTDNQDALQLSLTGGTMSGAIAMGSNNITGLAAPTANDHATTKLYVDNILGSATVAATSASNAATSESNAATSETNAANSATAAASSATSAAASYDSFDDRYLGAKSSAPTVDNDGDALITGALYFDTTTDTMKVYGSSGWVNAGSSVNGTSDRQTYTATAGQTVFAATYDAGYVDVYLNGVKLLAGTDFTATNGTSITLASGAAVNDIVDIVAYGTFVLADHLTETQSDAKYVELAGDTMTGALTTTGLTVGNSNIGSNTSHLANMTINNNGYIGSASATTAIQIPTGGGINVEGSGRFENSAATPVRLHINNSGSNDYASIYADTTSAYKNLVINPTGGNVIVGGTSDGAASSITLQNDGDIRGVLASGAGGDTLISAISGVSNGYQILVDGSNNQTYKWHNGGTASMTLASTGTLAINKTSPSSSYKLDISGNMRLTGTAGTIRLEADDTSLGAEQSIGRLEMYANDTSSNGTGVAGFIESVAIDQYGVNTALSFGVRQSGSAVAQERLRLQRLGEVIHSPLDGGDFTVNAGGYDADFRVASDNNTHMLFVDASNNSIGINTSSTYDYAQTVAVGNTKSEYNATQWASFSGAQDGSGMLAQNLYRYHDGSSTSTRYVNNHGSIGGAGVLVGSGWNTGKLVATNTAATAGAEATNLKTQLTWQTDQVIVNDDSDANIDFRVESNAYAHMFFVDAGANQVRLGTSASTQAFTTTAPQLEVTTGGSGGGGVGIKSDSSTSSTKAALSIWTRANGSGSTAYALGFYDGPTGTAEGSITVSNSGTTYNTTSDRRLKTDIQPIANGTEKLMAMNPVTHKWKADPHTGETVHGFIAQEMQEIVPEAVSGDPDGEEMMSMDYGRITPVLVAALQDAHKKIEALEKRLAELEAK